VKQGEEKRVKKRAFTMIELVFVIVLLGILAALALSRIERDSRQEAADTIVSAIRYTQHLALLDNKAFPDESGSGSDPTALTKANWQRGLWHIRFSVYGKGEGHFFTLSSSLDGDSNVDRVETATDPANGKYFYHRAGDTTLDEPNESPAIFLTEQFGINSVDFRRCSVATGAEGRENTAKHIAFDYRGRPHKGIYTATNNYASVMQEACIIVFGFKEETTALEIRIEPETGYVSIVGEDAL
jgi:prepilin-type N-terminal cleavage/methylation domain-containing protein